MKTVTLVKRGTDQSVNIFFYCNLSFIEIPDSEIEEVNMPTEDRRNMSNETSEKMIYLHKVQ